MPNYSTVLVHDNIRLC